MTSAYPEIIEQAESLVDLIKEHEITISYQKSLAEIGQDKDSQELLKKLVLLGKDINDRIAAKEKVSPDQSKNFELLKSQLDKNNLVKEHIKNQNQYTKMMQEILNLIKDPIS